MRIRTLVLISLTAVLVANVHGNNVQKNATPLPVSQYQISANAPQKVKLQLISPETAVSEIEIRQNITASRTRASNTPAPNITSAQLYAKSYMGDNYGWGQDQYECLVSLWDKESGWRYNAKNPSSGAYGIPQSLPGNKMASAGSDWKINPQTQIIWGLGYIESRYNTPCSAWSAFKKKGWY
jgi:hypothetical protein